MSKIAQHLKASFENTTCVARGDTAKNSYAYADRMCQSSLFTIQEELDRIANDLRNTGDTATAIEKLETFTGVKTT